MRVSVFELVGAELLLQFLGAKRVVIGHYKAICCLFP